MPYQTNGRRNYKNCTKCGIEKPISEFSKKNSSGRKEGTQPRCKTCAAEDTRLWNIKNKETAKDRYLKRTYGISEQEYNAMLLSQENKCIICEIEFSEEWGAKAPVVDHCHVQGHVRGILCNECNRGLGYFHDNPEALKRAASYLTGKNESEKGGCSCHL